MDAREALTNATFAAARRLAAPSDDYEAVTGDLFDLDFGRLIVVTVLVLGLGSLAAGAGIGGGGLFVPLYAFVLGVGAKAAVPMSKGTILGAAIGNMISIGFHKHPDPKKNKPLIDYEASTFMQSGELLGVVFGVLLNLLLPAILLIVFLAVLLSYNAYTTLKKGRSKYKAETEKMIKQKEKAAAAAASPSAGAGSSEAAPPPLTTQQSLLQFESSTKAAGAQGAPVEVQSIVLDKPDENITPELQKVLDGDSVQFPLWAWAQLAPMTAYTIFYAIVKKSVLSTCNPVGYWLWYFSPVPVLGGFMFLTAFILKRKHQEKLKVGYTFKGYDADGKPEDRPEYRDMKWDNDTLKKFPSIAILAGVAAGLLGIGGGMVIGPLFIKLDMQPKVGSSSCAFMILWTALSGVVQYAFAGKLGWQFILYGIVVGLVSGQMGQQLVDSALRRTGRPSLVIFLLGGIVLAACVVMTISGIVKVIIAVMDNEDIFVFDTYSFECHDP